MIPETSARHGAQVSTVAIPAGAAVAVEGWSQFIRIIETTGPVHVTLDGAGGAIRMTTGDRYTLGTTADPWRTARLQNRGSSAIQVTYAWGWGDLTLGGQLVETRGGGNRFHRYEHTVGTVPVLLLAANTDRTRAVIRSGADDLWVSPAGALVPSGVPDIPAGGHLTVEHRGDVWGVRAVGGGLPVAVMEETR